MAIAQHMNTVSTRHPRWTFLAGLVVGAILAAASTVAAMTLIEDNRAESNGFVASTSSAEWAAPRVVTQPSSATGIPQRSDDDILSAPRIEGGQTYRTLRAESEEESMAAPRMVGLDVSTLDTPRLKRPIGHAATASIE